MKKNQANKRKTLAFKQGQSARAEGKYRNSYTALSKQWRDYRAGWRKFGSGAIRGMTADLIIIDDLKEGDEKC